VEILAERRPSGEAWYPNSSAALRDFLAVDFLPAAAAFSAVFLEGVVDRALSLLAGVVDLDEGLEVEPVAAAAAGAVAIPMEGMGCKQKR
jgi:hypothetical protein